jgi:hypothetical protein
MVCVERAMSPLGSTLHRSPPTGRTAHAEGRRGSLSADVVCVSQKGGFGVVEPQRVSWSGAKGRRAQALPLL